MARKKAYRLPKNRPPSLEPEEEPMKEQGNEQQEEPLEEDPEEVEVRELGEEPLEEDPEEAAVEKEEEESGGEEEEGKEWDESDHPPSPSQKDSKPTKKRPSEKKRPSRSRKKVKIDKEGKKDKSSSAGASSSLVGKVWCEEDEITVLQGLIDRKKEKGIYGPNDIGAFHEIIKEKLVADISRAQLYDKVRRLKKKYSDNVDKAKLVFSKPHESKVFELSRSFWGTIDEDVEEKDMARDDLDGDVEKKNMSRDDLGADTEDFHSKYPNLSESLYQESSNLVNGLKSWMKDKFRLIGSEKAEELERKWNEVREDEAKVFLKKTELIAEQTRLLLDATKNLGNQ